MKKFIKMKIQKKTLGKISMLVIIMSGLLSSCIEDAPTTIATFTKDMMGTYLEKNPDQYSEFYRLVDTTNVLGLLNAYGEYTLFAPSNEAMQKYYKDMGKTSLKDFTIEALRKVAYDHLIKGYVLTTDKFTSGLMPYNTMGDRFLEMTPKVQDGNYYYFLNQNSAIIAKNAVVNNGVVHEISQVIVPSVLTLDEAISADPKFKLFTQALIATGLVNKIKPIRDDSYDPKNWVKLLTAVGGTRYHQGSGSQDELPEARKYGFTAFVESDSTYKNVYGIETLDQLKAYAAAHVYNEDASDAAVVDVTNPRNSLYKFVAYHLISRKLPYIKLINMYDTDNMLKQYNMYEYLETMNPNTLMEITKDRAVGGSNDNFINKSPFTGESVQIEENYRDKDALNGVYHEINKILIYDNRVAGEMSSKRIRIDAAAFFDEFANNNMRIYDRAHPRSWVYPPGYIERLTFSDRSYFSYSNAFDGYLDYQSDEVFLLGLYDFEMITPPIPAGTYEVRFSYQPTGARGAAQLYWDKVPCGIPLDLRILASDPLVGWVNPGSDAADPYGYENDKMLRNRGYMKGPCTYKDAINKWYGGKIARNSVNSLRRILGTYTFTKSGTHIFTVKGIRSGQFMLDFLEFVPVEMIENEDIQ